MGYMEIVKTAAHLNMMSAVYDVMQRPEYITETGEVCYCINCVCHCCLCLFDIVGHHWCPTWLHSQLMHTTQLGLACLEGNALLSYSYYFEWTRFLSTKKVLGITTLSRADHSTAQTRELACTKLVLPQMQKIKVSCKAPSSWLDRTMYM